VKDSGRNRERSKIGNKKTIGDLRQIAHGPWWQKNVLIKGTQHDWMKGPYVQHLKNEKFLKGAALHQKKAKEQYEKHKRRNHESKRRVVEGTAKRAKDKGTKNDERRAGEQGRRWSLVKANT